MCTINWTIVLEYIKVFLSWPSISLVLLSIFFINFRESIRRLIDRIIEGNVFGQTFKTINPIDQQPSITSSEENLSRIAQNQSVHNDTNKKIPDEYTNDISFKNELDYVIHNPVNTIIEYRKLFFNYQSERLFNSIFGSQIFLLNFISEKSDHKAVESELYQFHHMYISRSGNPHYQFSQYINFLVSYGVLEIIPSGIPTYMINKNGIDFLAYIKQNYAAHWTQRFY